MGIAQLYKSRIWANALHEEFENALLFGRSFAKVNWWGSPISETLSELRESVGSWLEDALPEPGNFLQELRYSVAQWLGLDDWPDAYLIDSSTKDGLDRNINHLYVRDTVNDRIIKTEIDGKGWSYYDYRGGD